MNSRLRCINFPLANLLHKLLGLDLKQYPWWRKSSNINLLGQKSHKHFYISGIGVFLIIAALLIWHLIAVNELQILQQNAFRSQKNLEFWQQKYRELVYIKHRRIELQRSIIQLEKLQRLRRLDPYILTTLSKNIPEGITLAKLTRSMGGLLLDGYAKDIIIFTKFWQVLNREAFFSAPLFHNLTNTTNGIHFILQIKLRSEYAQS